MVGYNKVKSDAEPERPLEAVVGLRSSIYSASVIVKRLVACRAFSENVTTTVREVVSSHGKRHVSAYVKHDGGDSYIHKYLSRCINMLPRLAPTCQGEQALCLDRATSSDKSNQYPSG